MSGKSSWRRQVCGAGRYDLRAHGFDAIDRKILQSEKDWPEQFDLAHTRLVSPVNRMRYVTLRRITPLFAWRM